MPEFTTRFEGLIVHTKLDDRWISALVNAEEHTAVLAVPLTAIEGTPTMTEVASGKSDERWFDISGQLITCDLPAGMPGRDASFEEGVAHLEELAPDGAVMRLTAQTITPVDASAFSSLFQLPAGQLFGVDFFSHAARFGTIPKVVCVAQAVQLASSTTATAVTFSNAAGGTVTVSANASARFQNISPDSLVVNLNALAPPANAANNHFRFYKRAFVDQNVTLQIPQTLEQFHCDRSGRSDTRISVECSNTQYP